MHGGMIISNHIPNLLNGTEYNPGLSGYPDMSVFVAASYRVTEKLTLHGSGVKSLEMISVDDHIPFNNFHDLSVGATYNFGNFSIGASFHRTDPSYFRSPYGAGDFHRSPFGVGIFGSPFF
jgi:hypothetical protein